MNDETLDLIDLDQKRRGYRMFLSCWLYRDDDLAFIVDPGPRSTVGHLIDELKKRKADKIDYVLLTHIHLDHSGGAAEILDAYPNARLFCHESGIKHLVSPSRLWLGSREVLGEVAEMYGEPTPVPADRFASVPEISDAGIEVVATPGHAVHHVSFLHKDVLFAGETLGTRVPLKSGRRYLRPATPPRFFLEQSIESLERLLSIDPEPKRLAFAHYGASDQVFSWCDAAKRQLISWVEIVRALVEESQEGLGARLFERLMQIDPLCGKESFDELDDDLKERERHFFNNTLDGILGYLKEKS